jgi:hypothetical protein
MEMNYDKQSLRGSDQGKLKLLSASNSCGSPLRTWNTSAKLSHRFHISNINQSLILYNCATEAAAATMRGDKEKELVDMRLRCGNQSKMLVGAGGRYDEASDYGGYAIEGCDTCVVPVMGSSSGEANASDYKRLIKGGFLMTWENPGRKFAPSNHLPLDFFYRTKRSIISLLNTDVADRAQSWIRIWLGDKSTRGSWLVTVSRSRPALPVNGVGMPGENRKPWLLPVQGGVKLVE